MFESLSSKLDKALKTIRGQNRINELNIATTVKEIRKALVDADVDFKVAKAITDEIKEESVGKEVLLAVKPGEQFIKIVYDKLSALMGGTKADIELTGDPAIILMSGLQGSGKTTFSGKLALYLKKQGKSVMLAACDVYRPAAIEQLKVLGAQIGVDVYSEIENKNPLEIAKNAVAAAKAANKKVLIVDTAGRLAIDEEMMREIENIKKALNPSETLFVVDAMTGQDAVNTAKTFNERLNFNGVVLTKLDGDSRGGAALSIRSVVQKPIKFIGTSEKMEGIDVFHPDRMAQRILGFGDVISFVERAQQAFDEEEAQKLQKKIRANQLDFNDLLSQLQQLKRMGNIKDLMGMIPGASKLLGNMQIDDDAYKPVEAIISSMTKAERANPDLLNNSRKQRIAKGSGRTLQEVNALLKNFEQMRKMMKQVSNTPQVAGKKIRR